MRGRERDFFLFQCRVGVMLNEVIITIQSYHMGPKSSNLKFKHLLLYSCSARALCATVLIKIQFSILLHIRGVSGYLKLDGQVLMQNLQRRCRRCLRFCPKLGGHLPTLPTRHLCPCYNNRRVAVLTKPNLAHLLKKAHFLLSNQFLDLNQL